MGRISFDPPAEVLANFPIQTFVYRYDGVSGFRYLPNVAILSLTQSEGDVPSQARFLYRLDDSRTDLPFPTAFEALYPMTAVGPWRLGQDDRLVVRGIDADGDSRIIFDGFAQSPELNVGGKMQQVSFVAFGVEIRLWDSPAEGAAYRDADNTDSGDPVVTNLPVRFNPNDDQNKSQPNATADGKDVGVLPRGGGAALTGQYPIFLDPKLARDPDPRRFWTLGMAIRYLLWRNNPSNDYVFNGDTSKLDEQLKSIKATLGDVGVKYEESDIILRDYDASNRPAIESIAELCEYNGFSFRFALSTQSNGQPQTAIRFYRKDGLFGGIEPKDIALGKPGPLQLARFNVGSLQLTRDTRATVNTFEIETAPLRYEVSLILAPMFTPTKGDEGDNLRKVYLRANWDAVTPLATRERYRKYGFDEVGDGHWDTKKKAWITSQAGDLGPILNVDKDGKPLGPDQRRFVKRYRPALSKLLVRDKKDKPLAYRLDISRDSTQVGPAIWDGKGTWQPISGGYELLEDALGIILTCENPEDWPIGKFTTTGVTPQNNGPSVRGITSLSNPSDSKTTSLNTYPFVLRLTCTIEGDFGITAKADRRSSSPTRFPVLNRVDARDNFLKETIDASSAVGKGAGLVRDDTTSAVAYAESLRAAKETAPSSGTVTIPRFTDAYAIGDRIRSIAGRNCSLQSSAGSQDGQPIQYPTVTSITWNFDQGQSTTLTLTDRRHTPQPVR